MKANMHLRNNLFSAILLCLFVIGGCQGPPKQPDPEQSETDVLRKISADCNCDANRIIDYSYLQNEADSCFYDIDLRINCDKMNNPDSLKAKAREYFNLINGQIPVKFKTQKVIVNFICSPANGMEKSSRFEFDYGR